MQTLWKAAGAAALFCALGSASATVIGFDDLPTFPLNLNQAIYGGATVVGSTIPNSYMGLVWDVQVGKNMGPVFTGVGFFPGIAGATTTSGNNFVSSNEGTISFSMPDGGAFEFKGFSARSALPGDVDLPASINVIGIGANSEYLRKDFAPISTYQRYNLNWTVTSIMFGLAGDMLIDDIEVNRVPEPDSLALMAAGLCAAVSMRRKRRKL